MAYSKLKILSVYLISAISLVSCGKTINLLLSPSEEQGLEGNASNDMVTDNSVEELKELLEKASKIDRYSYEVTSNIAGNETHFINYFTPYAWYELNDNSSASFGYAMTKDDRAMFKYYLNENNEIIPSIYEYGASSSNDKLVKVTELYSSITLAHISMLETSLSDFTAIKNGTNSYTITESNTASVFQYLTSFGSSLIEVMTGVSIEVINFDTLEFKSIVEVGEYGSITGLFKPLESTPIDHVDSQAQAGTLVGVDYYDDTAAFFEKTKSNNYILNGIKQTLSTGVVNTYPYTIYCTDKYFYLTYNDDFKESYTNWGFVLVPKNTEVTYYVTTYENDVEVTTPYTQTLHYDACYEFVEYEKGKFRFTSFVGPVEQDSTKYLEVDVLPETGNPSILYIVEENGKKVLYHWVEGSGYAFYNNWINCVGDVPINGVLASFYLSGSVLSTVGKNYYEKDFSKDNYYYSTDTSIMGAVANGLFGWGFQSTSTWMDFVTKTYLEIEKEDNEIVGANIGLHVNANVGNGVYETQKIFYTLSDFGNGNSPTIEEFINGGYSD